MMLGEGGLFRDRDPKYIAPAIHKCDIKNSMAMMSPYHRHLRGLFCMALDSYWTMAFDSFPISRRGWVFQERLLCPRSLHFAHGQLIWECGSNTLSETYPLSALHIPPGGSANLKQLKWESKEPLAAWQTIVAAYSGKALSFESDIFPALAGIAARYALLHEISPGTYLAGLWSSQMPHALLWKTHTPSNRSKQYRAPLWSWASVISQVNAGSFSVGDKYRPVARLQSHDIHLADRMAAFGALDPQLRSTITLECRLAQGHWRKGTRKLADKQQRDSSWVEENMNQFRPKVVPCWDITIDNTTDNNAWWPDEKPEADNGSLVLIPLLLSPWSSVYGITVQSLAGQSDTFARTGYFSFYYGNSNVRELLASSPWFQRVFKEKKTITLV